VPNLPDPAPGRGVYRHLLEGEPAGVEEYFVVQQGPHGAVVRTRRTAPGGVHLEVAVDHTDVGTECRISYRRDDVGPVIAVWELSDGRLEATRHDGATGDSVEDELTLDDAVVVAPLLRVFEGPTVAACLGAEEPLGVVVPDLRDPTDGDALLRPVVERRSARREGVESTEDGLLRHCRFVADGTGDATELWLDPRDRLVRCEYSDPGAGSRSVRLVESG